MIINPSKSTAYTVANPTDCDDEVLPTDWQTFAEEKGIPEPDIWPLWRRFKNISSWPFRRKAWVAYIEKVVANKTEGRTRS